MLFLVGRWVLVGLVCVILGFCGGWVVHDATKSRTSTVVLSTQDNCQGLALDYDFCK